MENREIDKFLEDMDEIVFTRITPSSEDYQIIREVVHYLLLAEENP